jgi:hypothetical protein
MRATLKLSLATLVFTAAIAACSDARANDATANDDFKRDLQLASSTNLDLAAAKPNPALLTSLETKPQGAPEQAAAVRRGAGPRSVRSETPTVRATPETEVAAVEESQEVVTIAEAPAPENVEPVAVAPRPQPVVIQTGGSGDYGVSGNGGGVFGGSVIRGGGVDGDNCEAHARGGRGRTSTRGPVFVPNPGLGSGGGFGGSRVLPQRTVVTSAPARPVGMRPRAR